MSSSQKLLDQMRQNANDWRIDQLITVVKPFDVGVRMGKGSHVIFEHPLWLELLCIPARRPIKPIYVKKLILLLDILGRYK